jgi:serine/threonine-protein kinase
LVAAIIGTFGSHIIHRTRREAFQAKQILQYRLQEKIGSGGMGEVYSAEHVLLKRPCAMKLIKVDLSQDKRSLARFEREVVATAKLSHWNTVDIYDYGHTEDGTFYYVMELLRGENLQTIIQRYGPMDPSRAAFVLAQVCDALAEAHEVGLIHRDIKPANIFLACRGGVWDVVKLLDFGLVREVSNDRQDPSDRASGFSGTPQFMAPEQATRYESVDGRSDLYALGAVGYYLLSGHPPFEGKNTIDLILAHAAEPVRSIRESRPEVPEDLELIILKCLAKVPSDRYQFASEVAHDLRQCHCYSQWDAGVAKVWWQAQTASPAIPTPIPEATGLDGPGIPTATIDATRAFSKRGPQEN